MPLSKELLDILACPNCKGALKEKDEMLFCNVCKTKISLEDNDTTQPL